MAKTVAFAMQKGGTGKTTSVLAVGQSAARRGLRVLLIDADPQGTLSAATGADRTAPGLFEVMTGRTAIPEAVQTTPLGEVLAGSGRLAGIDGALTGPNPGRRLKDVLKGARAPYDLILIDTPPALGLPLTNALTASDSVVLTVQADAYSYQGLDTLGATVRDVRKSSNRNLEALGILVTRYDGRRKVARVMMGMLETKASELGRRCVVLPPVRECTAVQEASARGVGLYDWAPGCNASRDYDAVTTAVLGALGLEARRRDRTTFIVSR